MAQKHSILNSRAPVSPSTSPWGQCAGITKIGSQCKRQIKGKAFCHSHDMQLVEAESTPAAESLLTMNDIGRILGILAVDGYYQCAGVSKNGSRCKRQIKGKAFCHSHDMQLVEVQPTSAAEAPLTIKAETPSVAEAPLTMNDVTAKIPNLLPTGYYQCAGISKTTSRCKRLIKTKSYCHSHSMQLLDAISHNNDNKELVTRTITQVRSHKGPIDNKLADIRDSLLHRRHWTETHVNNFENLLRNIKKGPLRAEERDHGVNALVPQFDHVYVCRGHTKVGRSCRNRTVGAFYCRHHDPSRITAGDVEMAFAAI